MVAGNRFLSDDRWLSIGLALFVSVLYGFIFLWALNAAHVRGVSNENLLASGDAHDYVSLARTMLGSHRFALTADSPSEFFRVPGYPIFAAGILLISNSLIALVCAQILLIVGTCVLIYMLGIRFFSRTVGFVSALLFAFDPTVILNSLQTLSEPLFVFLLCGAVYLVTDGRATARTLFLAGLVIGAATLTRPVGPFVAPLFLLYLIWIYRSDRAKLFRGAVALLLGVALVVTPWLIRNEVLSGHFAISSAPTYNILFYNVVEYENEVMGVPKDQFIQGLYSALGSNNLFQLRSFEYEQAESALLEKYLGPHLFSYGMFHVVKTIPFFVGSSISDTQRELINMRLLDSPQTTAVNVSGLALSGNIGAVVGELRAHPFETTERALWLLSCIAIGVYILYTFFRRSRYIAEALLFAALIAVLALIIGPIAQTRYRIPAEPFIFLLTFEAVRQAYLKITKGELEISGK